MIQLVMVTVFPSLRSLKAQTWRQIHGSSLRINGQVPMVPARTLPRMAETFSSDVDVENIEDQIMVVPSWKEPRNIGSLQNKICLLNRNWWEAIFFSTIPLAIQMDSVRSW